METETDYLIVEPTPKEEARLMSRISIDKDTGCWNWIGYIDQGGYCRATYKGKVESAHRVFYAWKIGKIPRGKGKDIPQIDHLCRNRRCCNPDHLELVTFRENILRGNSPSARHARQIYCKRGHVLPSEFNYFKPNGRGVRICPICTKETEESPDRRARQAENAKKRMNGPRREELLRKHREEEVARRKRLKHAVESP